MSLISMRQLLDHAAENTYGVPAFNVNNLEQIRAIMEGASEMNSPVIMQASAGARKYAGAKFIKSMIEAAVEEFSNIPIVMHQDHGATPDDCKKCMDLGFSSVMMDGSLLADQKIISETINYINNCIKNDEINEGINNDSIFSNIKSLNSTQKHNQLEKDEIKEIDDIKNNINQNLLLISDNINNNEIFKE